MYLYKNIATGLVPRTPHRNDLNIGATTDMARSQEIILKRYAPLVAYKEECNGSFFQDIVPVKSLASLQTSTSSEIPLEIHTEQAFSDERPTFLSLACLRGDPNAITYILTLEEILKHLTEEEVKILKRPMWICGVDLSFILGGYPDGLKGPMPILSEDASQIVFDQDLMMGVSPEAQVVFDRIVDIWYKHKTDVVLETGDILVIDNRKALHGRSKFSPKYDGTDRFLIRAFARLH
jgi:L-asparagine oxygenase